MKIVDLAEHALVAKLYPAVVHAAGEVGTPQIRNQATVGGNVNQRPRCWYFRNEEFVCYKKGGSRCFAENGENQYHAIFGNEGPSHIVHPSSLAVPFVAYGARFRVVGPAGEREVPAADYFTMPTLQNVLKENVLEDEEILTHVILPAPGAIKTGHYEVRYKQSHDWPLAFTTVVLTMNGNTISSARVVLGAVAPVPWRSKPAEAALAGKPLNAQTAAMAAEAAVSEAKPMSGNAYKGRPRTGSGVQCAANLNLERNKAEPRTLNLERTGFYASSDVSQVDGRRALSEPAAQGHVRDVRTRSRRVHVLR